MLDTICTLQSLHFDVFVIRDAEPGVPAHVAANVAPARQRAVGRRGAPLAPDPGPARCAHHPPAQGRFDALTIAIVGDIRHSRVARSAYAGAARPWGSRELRIVAPPALMPEADEFAGCRALHTLEQGLPDADVVMMLRIQKERFAERGLPDGDQYFAALRTDAGAPEARAAGRDRDAPAADEPRHRDRLRGRRWPAVGDPRPGPQWRRGAHGGARSAVLGAARRSLMSSRTHARHHRARGRRRSSRITPSRPRSTCCACSAAHAPRARARQLRAPALRRPSADAPAAVDHARGSRRRLDRAALQGRRHRHRRRWPRTGPAQRLSVLGPIGQGFEAAPRTPARAALGGGVGIPPMVFLAEHLQRAAAPWKPLVLMGSEVPFPFRARPSAPSWCRACRPRSIACMPLLDECGVPSRLAIVRTDACESEPRGMDLSSCCPQRR